ncbi:MAG: phosphotransferase family protein [Ilumatobacteraceae bacterium]|nr:phosphotransferase family protein [Ilumatobacteraceae bacterium]
MEPSDREIVRDTLAAALGTDDVADVARLTGGASRQTWRAVVDGRTVIAQRQQPESERDMRVEAEVLRAAERGGVAAPRVLACVEATDGVVTLVTDFVGGETIARRLLRDDEYANARSRLTEQVGRTMARLHRIDVAETPELERVDEFALYREQLDEHGEPHPTFELALRWLEERRPSGDRECIVHGDLRLGNVIVDHDGLAAVIDWELAHIGSPLQDLGWACVPAWRFGSPLPAAGVGTREQLLDAYNAEAGTSFTLDDLRWWEVFGILRWGVMCITQAQRHLSGSTRSHELAAIGRRVCENEHDLFLALEGRW